MERSRGIMGRLRGIMGTGRGDRPRAVI